MPGLRAPSRPPVGRGTVVLTFVVLSACELTEILGTPGPSIPTAASRGAEIGGRLLYASYSPGSTLIGAVRILRPVLVISPHARRRRRDFRVGPVEPVGPRRQGGV